MKTIKKASLLFASLALVLGAGLVGNSDTKEVKAAETNTVTYTVASTSSVTTSGVAPESSKATFANTYTTKDQITSGKSQTLTLSGYAGNKITGIVLSMHSNSSKGAGSFKATAGTTTIASLSSTTFDKWYDNKSFGTEYRDVNVTLTNNDYFVKENESIVLKISATANSLYCQSFKITYEKEITGTTVAIDKSKTSFYVGEKGTFKYSFKDASGNDVTAEDVNWKSDAPGVLEIDKSNGNWTAISEGTATITLEVMDNATEVYDDTMTIEVKPIPTLTSLSIVDKDTSFNDGEPFTLGEAVTIKAIYSDKSETKLTENSEGLSFTIDGQLIKIGDILNFDKHNGKNVVVSYNDGRNTVSAISYPIEIVKEIVVGDGTWNLVTDISQLNIGDIIVLASSKQSKTAGNIDNSFMIACDSIFSEDGTTITSLNSATTLMSVGNSAGSWTFANGSGKLLGATDVKKLSFDKGISTWSINIGREGTTIQNATSSYGKILYNSQATRFTTYTSTVSATMLLPQIYKFVKASEYTAADFVKEWNSTIRGNENGLCGFLKEENSKPLKDLIARYNALTDTDKAELTDSAGVKISESIAYAQNVWEKVQTTDGDYGYGNGNSGVVITSNNSYDKTSLIALFAILGIVTISGYYIIEKKKFSK